MGRLMGSRLCTKDDSKIRRVDDGARKRLCQRQKMRRIFHDELGQFRIVRPLHATLQYLPGMHRKSAEKLGHAEHQCSQRSYQRRQNVAQYHLPFHLKLDCAARRRCFFVQLRICTLPPRGLYSHFSTRQFAVALHDAAPFFSLGSELIFQPTLARYLAAKVKYQAVAVPVSFRHCPSIRASRISGKAGSITHTMAALRACLCSLCPGSSFSPKAASSTTGLNCMS